MSVDVWAERHIWISKHLGIRTLDGLRQCKVRIVIGIDLDASWVVIRFTSGGQWDALPERLLT